MLMTFEHAAFNTATDYPGGARALGAVIGVNGSVLAHKVSLTDKRNQLTVPQARKIMLATNDYRMLHGLAADLDHTCLQMVGAQMDHNCMLRSISDTAREFGAFLTSVTESVSDGVVTQNELRRIDLDLGEMVASANTLRALCAQLQKRKESKPIRRLRRANGKAAR